MTVPPGTVALQTEPFATDTVVAELSDTAHGRAGAIVTFTGVVRADAVDAGDPAAGQVRALEFEAFAEMAADELERVRQDTVQRFALTGCTIVHRTGTLHVGDPIVLVAAAAAHRRAAFDAAGWAMDELKRRVPLWKREVATDGTTRWVAADDCDCHTS